MTDQPCLEVPFDEVEKWEKIQGSCARLYAAAEWGYKQALATPPPVPLPDHVNLIGFAFGREPWATWLRQGGCLESAHCELSDLMLAVLARWGRPATPSSEPPADGEVAELVAWLRLESEDWRQANPGGHQGARLARAAELLERTATPPPEPPTDEELLRLYGVATPCYHVEEYKRELDFVRAALERWGR